MFLGYQDEKISLVANTREELENAPCMNFTKIVSTKKSVELVDGVYYIGKEEIQKAKEKNIRSQRNNLLKTEIDAIVSNPLRWADLSEYEQNKYKDYRQYLLDYTEGKDWWESKPKTFEEYCKEE